MSGPSEPGVIEPAGRVLDLARGGRTEEPAAFLGPGVPQVAALPAAGADPDSPSARATAFSDLPAMDQLLAAPR